MDDDELRFKRLMDVYTTSLRSLGTANATGAIAGGVAFHAFEKIAAAQSVIKIIVILFLVGVLAFAISYIALIMTQLQMERYFIGSKNPTGWQKIFWIVVKSPNDTPLVAVSQAFTVAILSALLSLVLFLFGLATVIAFALHL